MIKEALELLKNLSVLVFIAIILSAAGSYLIFSGYIINGTIAGGLLLIIFFRIDWIIKEIKRRINF